MTQICRPSIKYKGHSVPLDEIGAGVWDLGINFVIRILSREKGLK
ncbi:MAG: hypothetical protein AAFR14_05585 [Bacteroidota bacterium]